MEIGAQLFTLRDFCKDLTGFDEALKKVADIGYKNVQVSGTCEFEAEWLKERLDKYGLKCVLTHTAPAKLQGDLENVINDHSIFGCKYIGLGWCGFAEENSLYEFFKTYIPIAEKIKNGGKYFMYHNHHHEFAKKGDKLIIEHITEGVSADILGVTLDTFWVQAGGADPAFWLEKLSGRVPCIHLKDFAFDRKMAPIGEGNINFDRVFEKAEAAGTEYMLVEQDDCYGEDPFDCLRRSYEYLKSKGFE